MTINEMIELLQRYPKKALANDTFWFDTQNVEDKEASHIKSIRH